MILLDTNVCVRILRGRQEALDAYSRHVGDVAIPFMVIGELYYGADKSQNPLKSRDIVRRFLEVIPTVHTNEQIMSKFGELKAILSREGNIVEDADILIAATALSLGCSLATENRKHFERFTGLQIDDWRAA